MAEAADDYEQALREIDRQRQDLVRIEALLSEHREREATLRNTLLTAQELADEVRENAQQEARVIMREAQGRADLLLEKTQGRPSELEREITELRLKRGDVETSLGASIAALQHALEFIRKQDQPHGGEKVRLHRFAEPPTTLSRVARERAERTSAEHAACLRPAGAKSAYRSWDSRLQQFSTGFPLRSNVGRAECQAPISATSGSRPPTGSP